MRVYGPGSSESDVRAAGGKALNLRRMQAAGFSVPEWRAIGQETLREFLGAAGVDTDARPPTADQDLDALMQRIRSAPLGPPVRQVIEAAYAPFDEARVAVRSSEAREDGAGRSFAGQFTTVLNCAGYEQVEAAVRECWASAFAPRVRAYSGALERVDAMGVIIQRMVDADVSGVAFSVNPVNGRRDQCMISAAPGLGEAVVSGAVDADTFVVDKISGAVLQTSIGRKEMAIEPLPEGGCVTRDTSGAASERPSVDEEQLDRIREVVVRLEQAGGAPQDVEWALAEDQLWVLQTRPVTSVAEVAAREEPASGPAPAERRVWDNSNVIESYGEVTSPLTFTFAQYVYHAVHHARTASFHLPLDVQREIDQWERHRLGWFNGHVYYNLLDWYRMNPILPFPALRRRMMEISMGVGEAITDAEARQLRPFRRRSWAHDAYIKARVGASSLWSVFNNTRRVERFLAEFDRIYEPIAASDYDELGAVAAYAAFQRLELELIPKWGTMVGLDGTILVLYGLLLQLTRRWLPDVPPWFYWQVGTPDSYLESAEAPALLQQIADAIRRDPRARAIVEETAPAECRSALERTGCAETLNRLETYVRKFRFRSQNELKMESMVDLLEDPSDVFQILKNRLAAAEAGGSEGADEQGGGAEPGGDVEAVIDAGLGGPRKLVYQALRRRVRGALAYRESVRLRRARVFGIARRLFLAMGQGLVDVGLIDERRDVFYLRLDELRGAFEGTIAHGELRPLVALRRESARQATLLKAPGRFETVGIPYSPDNLRRAGFQAVSDRVAPGGPLAVGDTLVGLGASPGVGEGVASVVSDPKQAGRGVLVTYRTDPSWATVLPNVKALVVERGSPLTHVAIVARELRIPTVVQVEGVTEAIASGMSIRVDGGAGSVMRTM